MVYPTQIPQISEHLGMTIVINLVCVLILILSVSNIVSAYNLQCIDGDANFKEEDTPGDIDKSRGSLGPVTSNPTTTARTINKVNLMISSFALLGSIFCMYTTIRTNEIETKMIMLLIVSILAIVQGSLAIAGQTKNKDCIRGTFDHVMAITSIVIGSLSMIGMIFKMVQK